MASVTGITAAKALDILGQSIVSGSINGSGHLILTKHNGTTIDAGAFSAIMEGILEDDVEAAVGPAVANAMGGVLFPKGTTSGVLTFTEANDQTLIHAMFTVTLNGNASINGATAFPASPKPGTQFAVRFMQDATGGRTLSLTNIKKSMGVLSLSTDANAIDIIVFMYDGTYWYAGAMGLAFS